MSFCAGATPAGRGSAPPGASTGPAAGWRSSAGPWARRGPKRPGVLQGAGQVGPEPFDLVRVVRRHDLLDEVCGGRSLCALGRWPRPEAAQMGSLVRVGDELRDLDGVEEGGEGSCALPGVFGEPQEESAVAPPPVAGPQVHARVQHVAQPFGHTACGQQRGVLLYGRELLEFVGEIQPHHGSVPVEIEAHRREQAQASQAGEPARRDVHDLRAFGGAHDPHTLKQRVGKPSAARSRSISEPVTRRPPPPSSGTVRICPRCTARSNSLRLRPSSRAARLGVYGWCWRWVVRLPDMVALPVESSLTLCALAVTKTVAGAARCVASLWITPRGPKNAQVRSLAPGSARAGGRPRRGARRPG